MTGEFARLPFEILDRIFQHLPRKNLEDCQLVCQAWYPRATHNLMNSIVFRNENEIERFLNYEPRMTSTVKKLTISQDGIWNHTGGSLSEENVKQLMSKVPNLQELEIYDRYLPIGYLKRVNIPTSITSMIVSDNVFRTAEDICNFIEILTKLRNTIQKFNVIIKYGIIENKDMVELFSFFPKLIEIDVQYINSVRCLADCLPFILAIPSLKSINFRPTSDIEPILNNAIQLKQRLSEIKKLDFNASMFLPQTLLFIINNFVGLKKIKSIINNIDFVIDSADSTVFLGFLDFIYSMDIYEFGFRTKHEIYQNYLSNIISKVFTQLPNNSQNLSRQLYIVIYYRPYPDYSIDHFFHLESGRDYCSRLQRRIRWSLRLDRGQRNDLFKCIASLDKINVDTFIFDLSDTPFIFYCLDVFFEFLSLLVEPKSVALRVTMNTSWSRYRPSKQLDHITQLEIHVVVESADNNNLALSLDTLSNLKTLRLIYISSEAWYPEESTCSLELPFLNIETLYLDVTLIVTHSEYLERDEFLLVIETNDLVHLYEVSITSLNATKLTEADLEYEYFPEFFVTIQSVQNVYLQVLDGMVGLGSINAYCPLSSSYIKKETFISL